MNELLRWLAACRGIEIEPGTELRFELSSFPSGGLGFLVILALVGTLAMVVLAYRRDAHRLSPGRRAVLAALRALAILVAFALLLEPNLVTVKRDVRPGATILLVDTSQSMNQEDSYGRAESIANAWRELGVADPTHTSRIQLVDSLLAHDDEALLTDLARDNDVYVYGFHSGIEPIGAIEYAGADHSDPEPVALETLAATGKFTNLGAAVRSALERHRDSTIAALLVVSDGRRNLGARGSEIARGIEQRRVERTLVLPIGDPSATRTVRLTRIDAPEKVFQKDPFTIRANVESQGYDDITVDVRLKRTGEGGDVEVLATETVDLGDGHREALVEFAGQRSNEAGVFTYVVEVEPPEFESPSPERHVQRTQVEVLGEQTRVLMIAGGPSHEFRFVRTQLMRDNTVSLSAWLLSADPNFPQDGNVVLEKLPDDREALDEYDVFVFLDPDASKLSPEFCELVRKQVEESGAGLWWVCGEIYTLEALRPTASTKPLVDILPVVPDLERADQRFGLGRARAEPLAYRLTPDGAQHKIARILDSREDSARLWAALPGFYVAFPVERIKPGAISIAEFVDPHDRDLGGVPLIATQFFGAGRVLYTGTDDTYRWRSISEHAHNRFWIKGLRHLFEGRLTAGNARLRLTLGDEKLELGSPQHVIAEVKTETFAPLVAAGYDLVLEREDGSTEPLPLSPVEGVPGQYETRFWPRATGFFQVRPQEDVGREVRATFQVVRAEVEKEGPADVAELDAIASAHGGVLCRTPVEFLAAAGSIESMSVTDTFLSQHGIWDSWVTVLVLLTLLSAEWWLRKRANLL
ncbi:MAG: hypothetical protein KDB80_15300 [Planctomycetes bacterium]|nr:hypothetical protein [Planctomycetota bacterium]